MKQLATALDARLAIGGNNPPEPIEPTPFDAAKSEIEDLFEEGKNWLDGAGVNSQAEADAVSKLLDMARKAEKRTDAARTEEKRPLDEAVKAIQAKYKPLLDRAKLLQDTCKKALQPWLLKLEQEKQREAEAKRREAEEKIRAAQEAARQVQASDLSQLEDVEARIAEAKEAQRLAKLAEKDRAHAKGGSRAVTLRKRYEAKLVDERAFARWAWEHQRDELSTFFGILAAKLVAANVRGIPGVEVIEIKEAV